VKRPHAYAWQFC
jgi:ornithine decarboxylase